MINVSIYKFDKNKVLFERINAKTSDISTSKWIAKNGTRYTFGEENKYEKFDTLLLNSNFDREKLNSIYSNLDTISFYKLVRSEKELIQKGYAPSLLQEKKHFYLSLPFFLVLMVFLAGIFTLNDNEKKQNTYYVLLSIIACVVIFYLKISLLLWERQKEYPLIISVWSPVLILSIFCSIGVLQINDK